MRYLSNARKDGSLTAILRSVFKTNSFFLSFLCVFGGLLADSRFTYAEAVPPLNNPSWADLGWTVINGSGVQLTDLSLYDSVQMDFGADANMDLANSCYEAILDIVDVSTGISVGLDAETMIEHLGDKEWLDENGYEFKLNQQAWEIKALSKTELAKNGMKLIHDAALRQDRPWYWDFGQLGEFFANNGKLAYEILFTDPSTGETIIETFSSILENIIDYWTPNIDTGTSIKYSLSDISEFGYGSGFGYILRGNGNAYQILYDNTEFIAGYYRDSNYSYCLLGRIEGNTDKTVAYILNDRNIPADSFTSTRQISGNTIVWKGPSVGSFSSSNMPEYSSEAEFTAYVNSIRNGSIERGYAKIPDLVNINTGNMDTGNKINTLPAVDPNQYIIPVPPEFTRNNIQELNQNRNNGEAEENGPEFETFINPYIYTDTPVPVPTSPPADDPFTEVYPVPNLNDVPAIVPQPDFPEEPELNPEDAEQSLELAMPDLKDIFPFCLPWDIYEVFQKFRANRKAPEINWTFESDLFGFSYTLHVDLEDYNTAAEILRLLELIAFIVGLAVATRKLIGA